MEESRNTEGAADHIHKGSGAESSGRWWERWGNVGSIVGAVMSVLSAVISAVTLIIVYGQLNSANESLKAATVEQIYSRMHNINTLFIEHPELRPYFYNNKSIDDPNPIARALKLDDGVVKEQVRATSEMMCDFFAQALIELKELPPGAYDGWKQYITYVYKNSPEMRQYYRTHYNWYQYPEADALFKAADAAIAADGAGPANQRKVH